ncbi:hypothetical protein [Streptomyces sp. NPDC058045]|uniref:hypothetical protein n=1 Tax=Streptomyces sp. NPDC058045 TaxID=3346311 RepID=UPI0036E157BE
MPPTAPATAHRTTRAARLLTALAAAALLAGCATGNGDPAAAADTTARTTSPATAPAKDTLLVTDFGADTVTFADPSRSGEKGGGKAELGSVRVGTAPYGIALGDGGTAWVATAEGVAAVDTKTRARTALIPHTVDTGPATTLGMVVL